MNVRLQRTTVTRPAANGNHHVQVAADPIDVALRLLATWNAEGLTLTREHVETAARWAGADFGQLYDIILSPASGPGTVEDEDPTAGFLYEAHWDRVR